MRYVVENRADTQRIGARIKAAREQANLSQVELGQQIGVSGSTISNYETGAREIGVPEIQAIARALHLPPSYFIEDERFKADDAILNDLYMDDRIRPAVKEHIAEIIKREHERAQREKP